MKTNKKSFFITFLKAITTHLVCQCLFLVPFAYTQQALAEEAKNTEAFVGSGSPAVTDEKAQQSEDQKKENEEHDKKAEENGGLYSRCDGVENDTLSSYLDKQQYDQAYLNQGLELITNKRKDAEGLKNDLGAAEQLQQESDPVVTAEIQGMVDNADKAKAEMDRLYPEVPATRDRADVAKAAYEAARACETDDRSYCTPNDRRIIEERRAAMVEAEKVAKETKEKYDKARSEYHALRDLALKKQGKIDQTISNVTNKQETQIISDNISGCQGSGATKTCELTGTLFQRDKELTELANQNIEQAKALAKMKSDALFDLELQSRFNGDYKLFESALKMEADSNLNLDDFEGLPVDDPMKTNRIKMMISNTKILAFSSAAVKDLRCTQHPKSEADSKAYHLFRAAAATYLLAQVNDTSLFSKTASCRANEQFTSDEKNEQIRTIERAANLSQEQLQNVCLRVDPKPPTGDYDWTIYGATQEEANKQIAKLASLKERCDEYVAKLRGPEYVDKPRTREAAIEMMHTALSLAIEELAAKREKLAVAYANVQKGKAWIKRVKTYIMTLLAMAAGLMLAAQALFALPFGAGIPPGTKLMQKAILIITVIVGIYLMSELARAKAFLKKWQQKLEIAKYFTHLQCNYNEAKAEEEMIFNLAEQAKAELEQEVQKRKNEAIEKINQIVNEPPLVSYVVPHKHVPTSPLEYIMSFIPEAHAEEAPAQERDPSRLANSLGVAYGSESFRYFLSQKVISWQGQANDITTTENLSNKVLRTVDDLAAPFIGGDGRDPIEGLQDHEKQGFPVPETRIVTIQNAINLMVENVDRLTGTVVDIGDTVDEYIELVDETKTTLDIDTGGLSDNDAIIVPINPVTACLGSTGIVDKTCSCQKNSSCSQYRYNGPGEYLPASLTNDGDNALDYGNSILMGDLKGANISAGTLQTRSKAVRDRIVAQQDELNRQRQDAGLGKRNINREAERVERAADQRADSMTSRTAPNDYGRASNLAQVRNQLLGRPPIPATNSNLRSSSALAKKLAARRRNRAESGSMGLGIGGQGRKGSGNVTDNYSFSALDSNGVNGDNKAGNSKNYGKGQGRGTGSYKGADANSSDYGYGDQNGGQYGNDINGAKNKSIFVIISKRYEKTAFPIMLTP